MNKALPTGIVIDVPGCNTRSPAMEIKSKETNLRGERKLPRFWISETYRPLPKQKSQTESHGILRNGRKIITD
jgi:hypothetical protein